MKPIILFRKSLAEENELEIAKKYFIVEESRMNLPFNNLIIPRYSALPYYKELEYDVKALRGSLINSYEQHLFVADIGNWYPELVEFTPRTWFNLAKAFEDSKGPWILKGRTNSRKNLWKTHMYATTQKEATEVFYRLMDDSLIGDQGVVIREFEKFVTWDEGIGGLPVTKEFRIFMYKDKVLAKGFYWATHPEVIEKWQPNTNGIPDDLVRSIAKIVSPQINFWVMDVAQREDGTWRLVELNDGQMSGLSFINPDKLYYNLAKEF